MDKTLRRWVKTEGVDFLHYNVPNGEADYGEGQLEGWGNTHLIAFALNVDGGPITTLELTEMTKEEITEVKKFIDAVFAEAQEVCELRDRLAREAFEDGDDSHYRLYRVIPNMVER